MHFRTLYAVVKIRSAFISYSSFYLILYLGAIHKPRSHFFQTFDPPPPALNGCYVVLWFFEEPPSPFSIWSLLALWILLHYVQDYVITCFKFQGFFRKNVTVLAIGKEFGTPRLPYECILSRRRNLDTLECALDSDRIFFKVHKIDAYLRKYRKQFLQGMGSF